MNRLEGRVALITGGLRGIGLATAERFHAEGASLILTDLAQPDSAQVTDVLAKFGDRARYLRLDVTSEEQWLASAADIKAAFGRLDIVVANAGTDGTGPLMEMPFAEWRRSMSVNADGVFLTVKTLTPMLAEAGATTRGGSSIIVISSIMGIIGYPEVSAYNAAKGAARLFSKSVALEFAKKGMPIRSNSVHPGFVNTPLLREGFERWVAKGAANRVEDLVHAMEQQTPVGRLAEPFEIAAAIAFLASDDASYMTGSELVVDGGYTAA